MLRDRHRRRRVAPDPPRLQPPDCSAGEHLAEGVRLAVEDLTAQISDLEAETVDLAAQLWGEFVAKVVENDSRADGLELGRRLLGYRRVSLALVTEMARVRGVSGVELMRTLGPWLELETLGE